MKHANSKSMQAPDLKRITPQDWCIAASLFLGVLAVYWGVVNNGFIEYDDTDYITRNPIVQSGLSWSNFAWAFTTFSASNWHPLTWISHMLDCQLWGMNPAGHHLHNLALHAINAALVFFVLRLMTGARWRSALVAALFAVHPLHVESVAWIAERKDVLSTLFGLLALLAYVRYTRSERRSQWYAAIIVCFAMSLLAKPMLVTLPFVLLLMDVWPLGRTPLIAREKTVQRPWRVLIAEKLPLLTLTAASSAVTYAAQNRSGAIAEYISLPTRIATAAIAYTAYLAKTFWPVNLAVLYPRPEHWSGSAIVLSATLLAVITIGCAMLWRTRPWLLIGWLFFLGTLVPVIGIVQVGNQFMADRYSYVPLLGIFIMIAWSLPSPRQPVHQQHVRGEKAIDSKTAGAKRSAIQVFTSAMMCMALTLLAFASIRQIEFWRTSRVLFEHTLAVTSDNFVIEYNLGCVLRFEGDKAGAAACFRKCLAALPDYVPALDKLANDLCEMGQYDEAVEYFRKAVSKTPATAETYNNFGSALAKLNRFDEAVQAYRQSLALDPKNPVTNLNLGSVLLGQRRYAEATPVYRDAVELAPNSADAHLGLAKCLALTGDVDNAKKHLRQTLELDPANREASTILERLNALQTP